ncbi:hypothetical protein C8J57DRAFT_1301795 [Mycena rebaudengoi]|nr:hypothetical protein C8J57DRAFT_1301795 [Mycena rebaudengoi]
MAWRLKERALFSSTSAAETSRKGRTSKSLRSCVLPPRSGTGGPDDWSRILRPKAAHCQSVPSHNSHEAVKDCAKDFFGIALHVHRSKADGGISLLEANSLIRCLPFLSVFRGEGGGEDGCFTVFSANDTGVEGRRSSPFIIDPPVIGIDDIGSSSKSPCELAWFFISVRISTIACPVGRWMGSLLKHHCASSQSLSGIGFPLVGRPAWVWYRCLLPSSPEGEHDTHIRLDITERHLARGPDLEK